MRKPTSYAAALSAATLLALAGLQPNALAADRVVTGNDRGLPASTVDANQSLSLTVRKTHSNPFDEVAPGELPPGPIAGASFNLYRVNGVQVTTEQGRLEASNMTVEQARERGLTLVDTQATDDSGKAVFTGLRPALYLLEEAKPDDSEHKYFVSNPKLIVLPLGSADGTTFTYDNVVVVKGVSDKPTPPPTTTTTPNKPPEETTPTPPPGKPTPPPTEPGTTPATSTTPVPGKPESPGPSGRSPRGGLAQTGADVMWIVGLGAALVLGGALLARRQRGERK